MTAGEYVKEKRKELKISLRQLAYKIDMSHTNISDFEKGFIRKKDTLSKILDGLKLNNKDREKAFELLGEDEFSIRAKMKIIELKKEIDNLKMKLFEAELDKSNSNRLDSGNKDNDGVIDKEFNSEFSSLNKKDKEKVLMFIKEFIKK